MNRIIYCFVTILLTFCSLLCYGQQDLLNKMMPQPVPKSPNAAALGKFGDYEVSHFTGLPNISIPIFEAKSGDLSVPITLSYHASGHKPVDIASWVGLGWSLSAGGQITRSVNRKPDEEHYLTHPLNPSPSNCGENFTYLQFASSGVIDTEPDIFSYQYPGGKGKFIFVNPSTYVNLNSNGPIGAAYLFPYAPILVNRVTGNKYEFTDEKGVLYRFGTNGSGVTSTEFTNAFNGGNPSLHATTAWNLMEIIAPNSNDIISFTYQNVGQAYRHDVAHSWVVKDQCFISNGGACPPASHTIAQPALNIDSDVNQDGINEIFFENGKIQFFLSSGQRSDASQLKYLDRIVISELYNGVYSPQKTVKFNYSYFTNAIGGNAALKLDVIEFKDAGNTLVQSYKFSYFTNTFSWNPSHANFLSARDFWGFYNGATGNTDMVLQRTVDYQPLEGGTITNPTIGGATNRAVNTSFSKEGVLKRIDYPTGGFTEFDYENHKYLNDQSVITNGGGLRVTKIVSNDSPNGIPVIKIYKYGSGESGVGKALFISNQFNYSAEQLYSTQCSTVDPIVKYRTRSYHSSFFNVDESSPVVYPYVTEYLGDPTVLTNGKTIYEFDIGLPSSDVDQAIPGATKVFRNTFAWKRGKLTKKTIYDRGGNKLNETTISYSMFKSDGKLVGIGAYVHKVGVLTCLPGSQCLDAIGAVVNSDTHRFATYTQSTGALLPTTVVEQTFQNGAVSNVVTTTTTSVYHADKLALLESSETRSNTDENKVNVNVYPFQFAATVNASSTGAAKGIYLLNTKNIVTAPIESYTYLQTATGTNQRLVAGQLTTYKQNPNNANHIVPDSIYLLELATPLLKSSFVQMTVNGTNWKINKDSRYRSRLTFTSYDGNSKITQFSKVKDIPMSFAYGYSGKLPVAEIKNAQNSSIVEFKYEGFEDSNIAGVVMNALDAQSGNKYFNGDYTISFTKPNTRSYVIEYFYYTAPNWIFISKPYTGPTMALTEGTRIDNIRIRPTDSQMTTYTYNPLSGITSVTDPNNITNFYEYDSFGRLKLIKDHNKHIVNSYNYHYYNH